LPNLHERRLAVGNSPTRARTTTTPVRLGALHALRRLAQDHVDQRKKTTGSASRHDRTVALNLVVDEASRMTDAERLQQMIDELRRMREGCEPKSN
jgi:hypothetical protein